MDVHVDRWKALKQTLNQGVLGSNPRWPTIKMPGRDLFGGLFLLLTVGKRANGHILAKEFLITSNIAR